MSANETHPTRTYYVATLARYVLVDARDENEARTLGFDALDAMYGELRQRLGRDIAINILLVRLATTEEIALWQFHQRMNREFGVGQ